MNKKLVFISVIILILIFSIIIFITFSNNQTDDFNENDEIVIDDESLFVGKWDDLFYSLDENSYSTWEFYENNTIKNSTTALSYTSEKKTLIKWYEFELEDNLIYLKFSKNTDYLIYKYVFTNLNNHLSIYDINDVLGIPMISLNKINN